MFIHTYRYINYSQTFNTKLYVLVTSNQNLTHSALSLIVKLLLYIKNLRGFYQVFFLYLADSACISTLTVKLFDCRPILVISIP